MIELKQFHPRASHVLVDGKNVGQYYSRTNKMVFTAVVSEATETAVAKAIRSHERSGCFDDAPQIHRAPVIPEHVKEAIENGEN